MNAVYSTNQEWHKNVSDHTDDQNGYMYLVNIPQKIETIFRLNVTNLTVGFRYEFSAYLANVFKPKGTSVKPNIRFKSESVSSNGKSSLIKELITGDISECTSITWFKYSLAFTATSSSSILSMISEQQRATGNVIAIDDIELLAFPPNQLDVCPSG